MLNHIPFNHNLHISHIYSHHSGAYLWIGDFEAATDSILLSRLNIKAILTASDGMNISYKENTAFLIIKALDIPSYDIYRHFAQSNSFIQENLNKKINVLVHCAAGISRSVTLVVAFLMKTLGLSFKRSLILVQSRRSIANPNYGFVQQLKKYQSVIKQKRALESIKDKGSVKGLEQVSQIMMLRKKQKQKIRYQFSLNKSEGLKEKDRDRSENEKSIQKNRSQGKKKRQMKDLQPLSYRQELNQEKRNARLEDLKVDLKEIIYKKLTNRKVETEDNRNISFPKIKLVKKTQHSTNSVL